jgi:hypothetical protein
MDITKIQKNKLYSMQEALQYIYWIRNLTTFRQLIIDDIENNNNRTYNAIVLQRGVNKRYYLKGENIIKILQNENL